MLQRFVDDLKASAGSAARQTSLAAIAAISLFITTAFLCGAAFVAVLTAQYTLVALAVGLTVAGILRYLVTPQIVAKFEAIEAALKRWPAP